MSNEDFSDVVFLFTARRTGGTALAHAFETSGFHLFIDPLNAGLANVSEAKSTNSDAWLSKHPKGLNYFTNYELIQQESIPQDLARLNSEWLQKGSDDYQTVRRYFLDLISAGRESGKPVCFKIEEVNIYEMLKLEFPTAKFVGLVRDRESLFDSYANQVLAVNNSAFFEFDLLIHGKHNLMRRKSKVNPNLSNPTLEDFLAAFEWVRDKHSDLVTELCDFKLEMVNGEHLDPANSERDEDPRLISALDTFRNAKPELKFGLDTLKIMSNYFSLVAERDGLVAERDGLVAERDGLVAERDGLVAERDGLLTSLSWRITKFLRKIGSVLRL